jgi:hypothetical protein
MNAKRLFSALLVLAMTISGTGYVLAADPVPPPPPLPTEGQGQFPGPGSQETTTAPAGEITPARVSYIDGEVSFWRPGATDWTPATVNTPLAPGDVFYTGPGGTVEIQVGPRAFVRAAPGAQIALDNHEPDYIQFRLTAGHAALDVRELDPGDTVELATPGAAFTIERNGYYHAEVSDDTTTFRVDRAGSAIMTPAGGAATPVAANQQVMVTGTESPQVVVGAAPALSAWDQWNYQRTDYLTQTASARYVPAGVYGTETLDQNGTWRNEETYGNVWVPTTVAAGWVPYSTGRWIWDPRFGWTWLDDASWGWAPYHYGRWVYIRNYWAWAPGPIVVRPVYSPALVVFLGGGLNVGVSIGRPVYWAPLGWGEPVIPWWGRRGFVGVASWHGWGGPRVVNNVVVRNTTVVNVQNINVYRNVSVNNAVVGVSSDRFGRGRVATTRVNAAEVRQLAPVRGAPEVRPVAASVTAGNGPARRPPVSVQQRSVVATRAPRDLRPALREQGLAESRPAVVESAPRIVPAPTPTVTRTERRDDRPAGAPGRVDSDRGNDRRDRGARSVPPTPRARDEAVPAPSVGSPVPPSTAPAPAPSPRVRDEGRPTPRLSAPTQTTPGTPTPTPVPPAPSRGRDEGRPEPRVSTPPAQPTPAPVPPTPRARDDRRPEPGLSTPPQAPAPAPAPRVREDRRREPQINTPAQPTVAPAPVPAAPAPRPREEARPAPRVIPPAQPAPAAAPPARVERPAQVERPAAAPPARVERPAQAERPAPAVRPAPVERPAAAPAVRPAPVERPAAAPAVRPAPVERPAARPAPAERPAAVQPEPRSHRFEPAAPSVGGKRDNRENAAVSEPGPRNKMRN